METVDETRGDDRTHRICLSMGSTFSTDTKALDGAMIAWNLEFQSLGFSERSDAVSTNELESMHMCVVTAAARVTIV